MKALILAAGFGSRLEAASGGRPKGLVEVGGATLLGRQIETLRSAGIHRICLVTGYEYAQIEHEFGPLAEYRYNPFYRQSNNIVSVLLARDWLDDDVLILYADLLYGPEMMSVALQATGPISLLVDRSAIAEGHALVSIEAGRVTAISRELSPQTADARFVGIARLSRQGLQAFLPELDGAVKAGLLNDYYTVAIASLARRGYPIEAMDVAGLAWCEIDSPDDLRLAGQSWS